jgi:peptidyl-prolyl cis-trans isomerase A (cyclophilin A)
MNRLTLLILLAACAFAQAPQTAPASKAPSGTPAAVPSRPDGLYAIVKTSMGDVTAQLYEKEAPLTVRNFVGLAKGTKSWKDAKGAPMHRPMYNGLDFYRIMMDGMIQTGDPTNRGDHECGITLKDEIRPDLKFDRPGRLAMANKDAPNTGGCQWFITVAPKIPTYDGSFSIFGQVVEGEDVVKAISRVPSTPLSQGGSKPKQPVKIVSITIQRVGPEPESTAPAKKSVPPKKK